MQEPETTLVPVQTFDHGPASVTENKQSGTMSIFRTHLIEIFSFPKVALIIVWGFIVTMTMNSNCIVKSFDIFKYHLVCHLIINYLFSIQPFSLISEWKDSMHALSHGFPFAE